MLVGMTKKQLSSWLTASTNTLITLPNRHPVMGLAARHLLGRARLAVKNSGSITPEGGVGERQYTFGMHVLPEYVINVVENAFVITLSASQLGISGSRTQFIPQTPRSYERMAKAIIGAG